MRTLVTLLLLISLSYQLKAQEEKVDKIESYKIAFITEKLNLTPKEAQVFWPVYNEYSDKLVALRKKERERVKAYNSIPNPTDAESEKFIKDYLACKQQFTDLTAKYVAEFRKVLPAAKAAKLVTLEHEFKMQLLHKYKEKKGH